jgi:hypothetical protein
MALPLLLFFPLQPFLPFDLVSVYSAHRFLAHAVPANDLPFVLLAALAAYGLVADAAFPHRVISRMQITL